VRLGQTVHILKAGDVIYLTSEIPNEWKNPGTSPARLFWVNIK
jgi:quercetin dioxygenase-like cupin family protein